MPIKPLVPPGPFINQPTFHASNEANVNQASFIALTVRPPNGQIRQLTYAVAQMTAFSGITGTCRVQMLFVTPAGTELLVQEDNITNGDGQTYDDVHIELSSVGGPILLTNDSYFIMRGAGPASGGSATADFFALTSPV